MKFPQSDPVLKTETANERKESDIPEKACADMTDDERIDLAAAFILTRYRRAFEELAK